MKVQEAIELINNHDELYCLGDVEDVIGVSPIEEGLDLDEHRWYSTATNYYQLEDGILGVFGAYQSFSEMQMWSDLDTHCEAFEGEAYTTVSYRPKSNKE